MPYIEITSPTFADALPHEQEEDFEPDPLTFDYPGQDLGEDFLQQFYEIVG